MKRKSWTFWLFLAGILLMLELATRVILGDHWYISQAGALSPWGVGDVPPSLSYVDIGKPSMPFRVNTNRMGTRNDREYAFQKPSGAYRILALGDSFTYGVHVNNHDSWPQQLEQLLRTEDHLQAEVLNLGVSGYTIEDEYFLLKEKAIRADPDLIMVAFYSNDLDDLAPDKRTIFHRKNFASTKLQFIYTTKRILCNSGLFCMLVHLRYQLKLRAAQKSVQKAIAAANGNKRQAYEQDAIGASNPIYLQRYLDATDRLLALAASKKVPVMFIFFPNWAEIEQPQQAMEKAKKSIQDHLTSRGIVWLDLLPDLRAGGNAHALYYIPEEWHMNPYGYWVTSRSVRDFLRKTYPQVFRDRN